MSSGETTLGGPAQGIPPTRWTMILGLADPASPRYRENLESLVSLYWKPVYRYVFHSWRKTNEEAKDLTQGFFLSLLERPPFHELSQEKGRFRAFLKASVKNFLLQAERDRTRLKRGGGQEVRSLDLPGWEHAVAETIPASPDEAFDREWVEALLGHAGTRLESQLAAQGKRDVYALFRAFHFPDGEVPAYEELAARFGISRFDVGNRLKSARAAFKDHVLALIGETVAGDDERRREFAELFGRGL